MNIIYIMRKNNWNKKKGENVFACAAKENFLGRKRQMCSFHSLVANSQIFPSWTENSKFFAPLCFFFHLWIFKKSQKNKKNCISVKKIWTKDKKIQNLFNENSKEGLIVSYTQRSWMKIENYGKEPHHT